MKIITKASKTFREKILRKPTQVILEPTNKCNLNCPYCMVGMQNEPLQKHGNAAHNLMTRPMGMMTRETFTTVRRELKSFGIKKVYLHFQGEPFLNKHTLDFASQLKEDGLTVGIFTNGQALNDEIIAQIPDAQLDLIRFSVDGASEKSYQKNRVGGEFKKVYENMKKVALACNGKSTRIEWQFLVLRNNENEINKAGEMAQEIGVHFFVKGFRETDSNLVPANSLYQAKFHRKPCTDICHQLGIYWNGDIVPCCYDVNGNEIMGNILEHNLKYIWNSPKYKEFRKRVDDFRSNPENEPLICKSCLRWR